MSAHPSSAGYLAAGLLSADQGHESLQQFVRELIPGASLLVSNLPLCPEIALYLLDPDYPQQALAPETALRLMDEPIYWIFCWASGQVLARFILDEPAWVAGKTVVDFGAGSGVVGIAAARAGAARVICCDNDPVALAATQLNARLNGVQLETCAELEPALQPDLITLADVLYDRSNMPLVESLLGLAPDLLLADSRVKNLGIAAFRSVCEYQSSTWPDLAESLEFNRVRLYHASNTEYVT